MGPRPASGHTPAHYASSDPGFEALALDVVLAEHGALLGRIKLCFGADRATFERELMPLVRAYAGYVHLLPATADNYFHTPGGLLQLGLETAFFSLQGTDAHIFSGRATISERRELEPRWRVATFIGGLCCELHRALSHLIVTSAAGEEWPAYLGGLADWLSSRRIDRYFVRWRPKVRESRGLGLFALPHVVPAELMQMLGHGNTIVLPQLMASIGGVPQYREHNMLDELVRRSMALVIDRNLLANADRYGTPQYGSHLERYLVDALRRLAAGHSAWTPNRDKSRVWFGPDGLFLAWPGAAEDVLSLLESDQLAGIPKSPHTLLELLLDAGVFLAQDAGPTNWSIVPPGAKAPIDAVKLSKPAIVLTGLDPMPQPLAHPLVAASPPPSTAAPAPATTPPPSGPATPPASPPPQTPVAAPPPTAAQQLSLLDGRSNAPQPDDAVPPSSAQPIVAEEPAPPPPPAIRLKAPMRLNPAVRAALADAIEALNDAAGAKDLHVEAEGVFVPLAAFEHRGIEPGVAVRALQDARMLRRQGTGGLPTLARNKSGAPCIGVILAAAHVEGIDTLTSTQADATQMPSAQQWRQEA